MKVLYKILWVLDGICAVGALTLFSSRHYKLGGLALTVCWLLLAMMMSRYKATAKFAYTVCILAAVTLSMSFPEYFIRIGGWELKKLIVPLLQIITFGVGCTMSWKDLLGVIKMPKAVLIGTVCHYVFMPLVGFTIAKAFGFPPEIAAGVVLVGCSPSGLASNVIAFISGANLALSVTITAVSTLLS
jgi:BASS family bile acid:Na+ symporter